MSAARGFVPTSTGRPVRAVLFDTFGTVVDWRTGIASAVAEFAECHRLKIDPATFADRWRSRYQPSMERIRSGERPYVPLDALHRENLDVALTDSGIEVEQIDGRRLDVLALAWRRLPAWPDSRPGISALRRELVVGPLSNANTSLLVSLSKFAGLEWDVVLGSDVTQSYKPAPAAYRGVVSLLELDPSEVMLVAAHNDDLAAAQGVGMATGFVRRPTEHGPGQDIDLEPTGDWDVSAQDIEDLARQLHVP